MTKQKQIERVIRDYSSDVFDEKHDALSLAHAVAKQTGYCFAVEGRFGWQASIRKPSLRYGRIVECTADGRELIA